MPSQIKFPCTASELSYYIIDRAARQNSPVNNLMIQRIAYMLQTIYCSATHGKLLFNDEFVADPLGPILPNIYYEFAYKGANRINNTYEDLVEFDYKTRQFINDGIDNLIHKSPWDFVKFSNAPATPWAITYKNGIGNNRYISNSLIVRFYGDVKDDEKFGANVLPPIREIIGCEDMQQLRQLLDREPDLHKSFNKTVSFIVGKKSEPCFAEITIPYSLKPLQRGKEEVYVYHYNQRERVNSSLCTGRIGDTWYGYTRGEIYQIKPFENPSSLNSDFSNNGNYGFYNGVASNVEKEYEI